MHGGALIEERQFSRTHYLRGSTCDAIIDTRRFDRMIVLLLLLQLATALMAVTCFFATSSSAQSYPTRPVRVVVPYPPGGANDTVMRVLAPKISHELSQQLVIATLNGAVRVALRLPDIKEKLLAAGVEATDVSTEQFDRLVLAELAKWDKIVKPLNIALE